MAKGDGISNVVSASQSAYTYITPGSGEEWLIMQIGDSHAATYLEMTTDNGSNWLAMNASQQQGTNPYEDVNVSPIMALNSMMSRDLYWVLTANDRIRSYNSSAAHVIWWMGIKTKD